MAETLSGAQFNADERRKRNEAWHADQKHLLGEDAYRQARQSVEDVLAALKPKIDAAMKDARSRGATKCLPRRYNEALILNFHTRTGKPWRQSIGYRRALKLARCPLLWSFEVWKAVENYVLAYEGFQTHWSVDEPKGLSTPA